MFTSKPHGEVVQQLNEGSEGEKGGGNVQHLDCGIMDGWMDGWMMMMMMDDDDYDDG